MNRAKPGPAQLEWLLAGTLHYGTCLPSTVIGLGLGLALIDSRLSGPKLTILRDMRMVTIGIAMFILLPVVRVIVIFIVYLRQRDYRLAGTALLVLTIVLLIHCAFGGKRTPQYTRIFDAGGGDTLFSRRPVTMPYEGLQNASRDACYIARAKSFPGGGATYVRAPRIFFTTNLRRIEDEHYFESYN